MRSIYFPLSLALFLFGGSTSAFGSHLDNSDTARDLIERVVHCSLEDPTTEEAIRLETDRNMGGYFYDFMKKNPRDREVNIDSFYLWFLEYLPPSGINQIIKDMDKPYWKIQFVFFPGIFLHHLHQGVSPSKIITRDEFIEYVTSLRHMDEKLTLEEKFGLFWTPLDTGAAQYFRGPMFEIDQLETVKTILQSCAYKHTGFGGIYSRGPRSHVSQIILSAMTFYRSQSFRETIPNVYFNLWGELSVAERTSLMIRTYFTRGDLLDKLFLAPLVYHGPLLSFREFLTQKPDLMDLKKLILTVRGIFENRESILEDLGNPKGLQKHFDIPDPENTYPNHLLFKLIGYPFNPQDGEELFNRDIHYYLHNLDFSKYQTFFKDYGGKQSALAEHVKFSKDALKFAGQYIVSHGPILEHLSVYYDVDDQSLEGGFMPQAPEEIQNFLRDLSGLTTLKVLDLTLKKIDDPGIESLKSLVLNNQGLEKLSLPHNSLGDSEIQVLSPAIESLRNLKKLHLHLNRISLEGWGALQPTLKILNQLTELDMSHNILEPEALLNLPCLLQHLPKLRVLKMEGGNIDSKHWLDGLDHVFHGKQSEALEILSFSVSCRHDNRELMVSKALGSFPNLKELALWHSDLHQLQEDSPLVVSLQKLKKLEKLTLMYHRLGFNSGVILGRALPKVQVEGMSGNMYNL